MEQAHFRIVIKRVEKPYSKKIGDEFNWLCHSLGFFEKIDKDKTASSVFREVIASTERGKPLTSTELAERVEMSRGSVINHLNRLIKSGLILKEGCRYRARCKSVLRTVKEIEEDIDRVFNRLEETARSLDHEMGLTFDE